MKYELITGVSAGFMVVAILSSCGTTTPRLDATFGDAVNKAKAQQTINPDASKNTDPVAGIDGQAAGAIVDRYHKAYQTPSPASTGSIGTVTGGSTTLK